MTKPQKKIKMSSTTPTQNFKIGEWQTTGKPVWNKTTIWQKIVKKIKNIRICDGKCLGEYFDKLKDEKRKI